MPAALVVALRASPWGPAAEVARHYAVRLEGPSEVVHNGKNRSIEVRSEARRFRMTWMLRAEAKAAVPSCMRSSLK